MNHLLSSFRSFKSSLVPETTLNRRKSIAFIRMFQKFNMKILLTITILFTCIGVYAQPKTGHKSKLGDTNSPVELTSHGNNATKLVTPKDTAKYNYFARVPASDYQTVASSLNEYKRLQIYDPNTTDAQKVQLFKNIEAYLKDLPKRVQIDSVKVK